MVQRTKVSNNSIGCAATRQRAILCPAAAAGPVAHTHSDHWSGDRVSRLDLACQSEVESGTGDGAGKVGLSWDGSHGYVEHTTAQRFFSLLFSSC